MPICQEHLTDSLVRTGTLGWNVISLADIRVNEALRRQSLARGGAAQQRREVGQCVVAGRERGARMVRPAMTDTIFNP
jgi:hypothetical protein